MYLLSNQKSSEQTDEKASFEHEQGQDSAS